MFIGIGFWLALMGLFLYLPSWVFAWVFRVVLKPLEIPDVYPKLAARERRLMIIAYMTIFILGVPLLILYYAIGLIRHLRRQSQAHGPTTGDKMPLIPRFTMADMLAMVFSISCTPVLFQSMKVFDREETVFVFLCAILTFPACFLAVLYRMQIHDVPGGKVRMALLAFSPFVAIASAAVIPYVFFALILDKNDAKAMAVVVAIVCVLILVIGRFLAAKAMEQAAANAPPEVI